MGKHSKNDVGAAREEFINELVELLDAVLNGWPAPPTSPPSSRTEEQLRADFEGCISVQAFNDVTVMKADKNVTPDLWY